MTTISSVLIYNDSGSLKFTFNPVPTDASFMLDNSPGKMSMDLPGYHRPYVFWMSSSSRRLTIKAAILGTAYSGSTILDQLNTLMSIMSGNESTSYLQIQVPFMEAMTGSPKSYSTADSSMDALMFATGANYMAYFCHPDTFTIDKIEPNIAYVTLIFSEASSVLSLV